MRFARLYTKPGQDVFDTVGWERRDCVIHGSKGPVFEMKGVECPASWSQQAINIVASKYFRKAGVPLRWADREYYKLNVGNIRERDGLIVEQVQDGVEPVLGSERSVKQVIHRIVLCWTMHGQALGYFSTPDDSAVFYDELCYMMLHQMAAPNSPQWFNAGLYEAYGIKGDKTGRHFFADHKHGAAIETRDAYKHPQVHACFLSSVSDTLVGDDGIFDLLTREASIFKYGSGTGTNFSKLRAENEPLSSGGKSSGLMSWLEIFDRAAGAVKSGGTTRRAAKMAILDADHPDIEKFVNLKAREELKVRALVEGSAQWSDEDKAYAKRTGLKLDYDFNGEAYHTVTGQNANNTVRLTDGFMRKISGEDADKQWPLTWRTSGEVARVIDARDLWDQINHAAWRCADPGVQFDTTIQDWHTCPNSGRIETSNPCSEHLSLNNTACNLASLNLVKFYDETNKRYDVKSYTHAVRLWTVVLEISVAMASYPSKAVAETTWKFRTLGLGYANLGALLMRMGLPYDSDEGRAVAAGLTSVLAGKAYATSAEMAAEFGPFAGYEENKHDMLRVVWNHGVAARAPDGVVAAVYDKLSTSPPRLDKTLLTRLGHDNLASEASDVWRDAHTAGIVHGFRNAQVCVIAPTGTIAFAMDCDTTGVEPDFALVKYKTLAGGGSMTIVNQSVRPALRAMGYDNGFIREVEKYILETGGLDEKMWNAQVGPDKARHIAVFDCAMPSGKSTRFIAPMGHVRMLAAVQPFVSGSISKTINMPREVGVQDIANVHMEAWKLGVKCVAVYRDGCKESQPLNTEKTKESVKLDDSHEAAVRQSMIESAAAQAVTRESMDEVFNSIKKAAENDCQSSFSADDVEMLKFIRQHREQFPTLDDARKALCEMSKKLPVRRKLPDTCRTLRHKFSVAEHEGYIHVGLYEEGTPGEVFIRMTKQGSTVGGLMESWAIAISMLLQYGVPLETLVEKFAYQRFEPHGMTANTEIPFAKSVVDYVARWLAMEFVPGFREQHSPTAKATHDVDPNTRLGSVINGSPVAASVVVAAPVHGNGSTQIAILTGLSLASTDAPTCRRCGSMMQRTGVCHTCPTCGEAGGCG